MADIFVRLIDLPRGNNALVTVDEDGNYNIYINSRLSDEGRREALDHEINHIKKRHLETEMPVRICEGEV